MGRWVWLPVAAGNLGGRTCESLSRRQGQTHPSLCAHFFPRICSPGALLSSGAQSTRTHPWFLSDPRLHPRGSVGGIGWSSQRGIQVHFPTVHGWSPSSRGPGSQVYCPGRGALGTLPGSAAPQMSGCELPAAWGGRLGAMSHRLGSRVQAWTAPLTQAAGGDGGG